MPGPLTYWHTIRHLKAIQIYNRVYRHIHQPTIDRRAAPNLRDRPSREWVVHLDRPPCMTGPDRFVFLNQTGTLRDHGWDSRLTSKLWRYNLHYFDDLNCRHAHDREEWHKTLLTEWVRDNPPTSGTGWESYPTSLRIVNWIKWSLSGNELPDLCIHSLAVQARWLSKRMETHLLGNHLLTNAKALIFAGVFFQGGEAESWIQLGLHYLDQQIGEQILPDGGQFEQSPMYHAITLCDILDLCNLAGAFCTTCDTLTQSGVITKLRTKIGAMMEWLNAMTHPDGEISLFGDAAFGIAPFPPSIYAYAGKLGFSKPYTQKSSITRLASSGYVRVARGEMVAMLDVGPIGPDYLPGHGHADVLSFELSLFGQRVVVDSGTSQYSFDSERMRQRGTAAHNTVIINGRDSSEVWGAFRVARRARPNGLTIRNTEPIIIQCSHDGYRFLSGHPTHTREWQFNQGAITIRDRVSGPFQSAQMRLHIHPQVKVTQPAEPRDGSLIHLVLPDGHKVRILTAKGVAARLERSTWHPEFGKTIPNQCVVVDFASEEVVTTIQWDVDE